MKHPRRLTLKEKMLLEQQGFNSKNFLRIKRDMESYEFLEVNTGKVLVLRR